MGLLPDLDELVALRGAAQSLDLRLRHPSAAQLQGGHRSAHRGRGLEFDEVRAYVQGDDTRRIDWRVTARRGRPHTKVYREEREQVVWLVADLHPGLYFGSRQQLKSALLLRAAAWLAWVAVGSGDRIGAVLSQGASMPLLLPPRSRDIGALAVLQALVQGQPQAPGVPVGAGLGVALNTLRPLLKTGSTVFVLSDFAELAPATDTALATVALRAECRLLWLTDPLERQGLPNGRFRVGLPGQTWTLDGASSRSAWATTWAQREQHLSDLSHSRRLPLLRLDTSEPLVPALPRFISESR